MFRVIKFDQLLKYVALSTVVISILLYSLVQNLWFPNYSLFEVVTISSVVSAVLIFVLLTPYSSRRIWALVRVFNKKLFPDLNGTWQGTVTMENGDEIEVRSVIRQSLLAARIDMHGETMKSVSLETTPTVELGQNRLYYVYRCTPKDPTRPIYNGSTLFDVRVIEKGKQKQLELSGHYYTDRKTVGRITLQQTGTDSSKDVSYY